MTSCIGQVHPITVYIYFFFFFFFFFFVCVWGGGGGGGVRCLMLSVIMCPFY